MLSDWVPGCDRGDFAATLVVDSHLLAIAAVDPKRELVVVVGRVEKDAPAA